MRVTSSALDVGASASQFADVVFTWVALQRLKHSFVALAGGDGPKSSVRPSKISDVCVLAGMDPAGVEVPLLLRELHDHTRRNQRLYFDDFLDVIINFRAC